MDVPRGLAFRPRWHIEDDTYRALKEGWGLEKQRWGRDVAAALGRTTWTCLAFNTCAGYFEYPFLNKERTAGTSKMGD
jgi:hypothetical protein